MPARESNNLTKTLRNILSVLVFIVILIMGVIEWLQSGDAELQVTPTAAVVSAKTPKPAQTTEVQKTQTPQSISQNTVGKLPNWLSIYFTDPNPPDNLGHGIDQIVQVELDKASTSIDVSSFDLNLPDLMTSLVNAKKRGVNVRVVYDGTNGNLDLENAATNNKAYNAIKVLKAGGVKLVDGGRSNGLMHDKIVIVDNKVLFMGSWNLSYNDTYRNNNNLLKITRREIIANYQAKFNEMFEGNLFGTHAEVKVPNPSLEFDGIKLENYFSPEDHVMEKLVKIVSDAKKSVHFMIFTFTDQDLASAMIARAKKKVDVQGVIEARGASQGALVSLYCAKLPVKTDGNGYTMHHKVIIVDDETVITGSFNFTNAADTSNDDNMLVLHSPVVAALYEKEYQRIKNDAQAPDTSEISCK
jgi:phosphatidylserine/phosphatidylglycerophosphate/cardiolipin synthase-like enzyme